MRKILPPLIAALAVVAGGLIIVEAGPAAADRDGGCPNPHSSKGAEKSNPHSAHGSDKQGDRDCGSEIPPAQTPTPSPTPTGPQADMKAVGVTAGAPSAATSGVAFQVSASVSTHNNGPTATAMVDVTFVLALPADCTATSSTTVTVLNRSLPMSSPVFVSRIWNVACFQPGSHQFTVSGSLAPSAGQTFTDPNTLNNSGSGSTSTQVN